MAEHEDRVSLAEVTAFESSAGGVSINVLHRWVIQSRRPRKSSGGRCSGGSARRRRACFLEEALDEGRCVAKMWEQQLRRDDALERQVAGAVQRDPSAAAKLGEDLVVVRSASRARGCRPSRRARLHR